MNDIVIIGAGPAGLMAGISAARSGKRVVIVEKNHKPGKKILASGGGRCNISNSRLDTSFYRGDAVFLGRILKQFSGKDLLSFFDGLGVRFKEESLGRIIPVTEQAVTVLDALLEECASLGVELKCGEEAVSVKKENTGFTATTGRGEYNAEKIIIAGGGLSYQKLGNSVKGAALAKGFGHKIVEQRPALVPVLLTGSLFRKFQGVKHEAVITVRQNGRENVYPGDVLFTSYGISGPAAMDASSLMQVKGTESYINFLPGFEPDASGYIFAAWQKHPERSVCSIFSGILNKKIVAVLLPEIKINPAADLNSFSRDGIKNIVLKMMNWKLEIKGVKSFEDAMLTSGGVSTDEINPETLESKLVKGLFFAGEIIDVEGISGGYNLQFAFSSGWIAGKG